RQLRGGTAGSGVVAVILGGPEAAGRAGEFAGVQVDGIAAYLVDDTRVEVALVVEDGETIALEVAGPAVVQLRAEQGEIQLVLVVLPLEGVDRCAGADEGGVDILHALENVAERLGQLAGVAGLVGAAIAVVGHIV